MLERAWSWISWANVDRLIHRPRARPARPARSFSHQRVEFAPRHRGESEPAQVSAVALGVAEHEAPLLQVSAERDEADFRRVRLPRKHRLDDERLADRHAIEPAGEIAVMVPYLDRMGVAGMVQGFIGIDDVGSDPSEMRAPWTRLGACPDTAPKALSKVTSYCSRRSRRPVVLAIWISSGRQIVRSRGAHHFCGPICAKGNRPLA